MLNCALCLRFVSPKGLLSSFSGNRFEALVGVLFMFSNKLAPLLCRRKDKVADMYASVRYLLKVVPPACVPSHRYHQRYRSFLFVPQPVKRVCLCTGRPTR